MVRALAHLGFALAAAVLLLAPGSADAKRVALVIGNDDYQNLTPLQKAVADAEDTAAVLRDKGFDQVLLKTNLTRLDMDLAIAQFLDTIEEGDTAVFFYSGHGWASAGQNFLVAVDAPGQASETELARISIPLQNGANGVLDDIARERAALKVAIIDACRDNPFTSTVAGRSVGNTRGLARLEDPPEGTFVIFSAGTGETALDRLSDEDANRNSVFTRTFLPYLRDDIWLLDAVKEVQEEVYGITRSISHNQSPAYYDQVRGKACLSEKCRDVSVAGAENACAPARAHYEEAKEINTLAALQDHLSRFRSCPFASLAEERIALLQRAAQRDTVELDTTPPKPGTIDAQCQDLAGSKAADEIDTAAAIDVCTRALTEKPGDYRLAFLLGRAHEAAMSFVEARENYAVSAEQGFADAQYALGNIFASGRGVPEDDAEALKWIRKSAEQGYARAQYMLGNFYYSGRGALEDKEEAVRWFELAARQGHGDSQYNLGQIYLNGDGIPRDKTRAANWFRSAGEQGHGKARFMLGYMYYSGDGVIKDDKEALRLFTLAAQQGDANANWLLGNMYYVGRGVSADHDKAAQHFLRALALKSGDAYRELIEKRAGGLNESVRRAIQNVLRSEGVYSGSIDGAFGAGTQSALEAYAQRG